jgi:Spy/CpxP family protein refolding chaperone
MNKRFLALVAAMIFFAGGSTTYQAHAAPTDRPGRGAILQHAIKQLDLKQEQIDKIKAALRAEKATLVPLIKNWHESRKALREAIHAPGATEATVREAAKKEAAVESDLAVERLKLSVAIMPILTEEQIEKVKQFEGKADEAIIGVLKRISEVLEQ